ncbi:MAG: 3-deoxy-manno-octulosonate cytidylyltransferase [Kordiimonadaceae bacterium]|nr:3-deoxy-manno-octulosonate cytidylyltransferase [Kordiimonadaceae bacterium]
MKIVIPARFASSRLPGKPLADILGKPMIQHVWERAMEAAGLGDEVIIAADDDRILAKAEAFGAHAVKTLDTHESGTDRIAEVAALCGFHDDEIIINLQGDEPLMPPSLVCGVGEALAINSSAEMATASTRIYSVDDVRNPNIVKVVTGATGMALYFSRSIIPHFRSSDIDVQQYNYQRHIGLYAYRVSTLQKLTQLPPAPAEKLEQLEQLRALHAGMKIYVQEIDNAPPHGVDTFEDLEAVRQTIGSFE